MIRSELYNDWKDKFRDPILFWIIFSDILQHVSGLSEKKDIIFVNTVFFFFYQTFT